MREFKESIEEARTLSGREPNPFDTFVQKLNLFSEAAGLESESLLCKTHAMVVAGATRALKGPLQRMEFLAKRLMEDYDRFSQKQVVLGSPIYVALDE